MFHEFMIRAGIGVVGAIAGGGLVWGFRGWIQRTKDKLQTPFRNDVQSVHSILTAALAKSEAELKADIQKVLAALSKWLPIGR